DAQVDDLIQLVVTSPGVSVPQNIGSATLRGHELNARVRLWDRLGLIGNYTHQDTRDDGGKDNTYLGKELPGRPPDAGYVRLELEWSPEHPLPLGRLFARAWPGQVFFETNFIGDNFLTRANLDRFHVDSRVLYGAGLRLSLPWPRWQVGIEGRNLTNDLTSDVAGFPVPGRSWFGSVSSGFARGPIDPPRAREYTRLDPDGLGKRVQSPRCPAAVRGDDSGHNHCPRGWEGAGEGRSPSQKT